MSSLGSITRLFNRLQQGERDIAQKLLEVNCRRLIGLDRKKLAGLPRAAADEEEMALSAFDSFCQGAEGGRFPQLADRDDLWQLLMLITARKAIDLRQHKGRDRRDWRRVCQKAQRAETGAGLGGSALSELLSRELDLAFAGEVAEESRCLLDGLADAQLYQIALREMEGYTNEETAAQLDCALSTLELRCV